MLQFLVKCNFYIYIDRGKEDRTVYSNDVTTLSQYQSHNRGEMKTTMSGPEGCLVHGRGVTGLVLVWSPLLGWSQEDSQELSGVFVSPHSLATPTDRQRYEGAA